MKFSTRFFKLLLLFYSISQLLQAQQLAQLPVKLIENNKQVSAQTLDKTATLAKIGSVVDIYDNLLEEGKWETVNNGKKRCILAYTSPDVQAINLYFIDVKLPKGSTLKLKGNYRNQEIGPYQAEHVNNQILSSSFVYGDYVEVIFEVDEEYISQTNIIIEAAGLAVRNVLPKDIRKDFGDASSCNVNISCEEGDLWEQVGRSVVRILIRNGNAIGWCSGVIVNNTQQDFTPYILSAMHCGLNEATEEIIPQRNFDQWIFFFNYETSDCTGAFSAGDISEQIMIGADLISHSDDIGGETGSDFLLLRLKNNIPQSFAPVFAGWSNAEQIVSDGVSIHHPQGDVKKISTFSSSIESSQFSQNSSIRNTHWRVVWTQTENGFGITEGGSSGAPLFNNAGQVIGTLTGGLSNCNRTQGFDLFGKVAFHWRSNGSSSQRRLVNWLDPVGLNITSFPSVDYSGNIVTNTENNFVVERLNVFPNPVNDWVNIEIPQSIQKLVVVEYGASIQVAPIGTFGSFSKK
ncbi:MAG: trypsin-like peptidase domain-containing protein [Bacteroidota bacterium]